MPVETHRDTESSTQIARPWQVVLYNDDWHTFEEVVGQIRKATAKTEGEAHAIMLEAHRKGRAVVVVAGEAECQRVAAVLRQIRLQVEVDEA